ncbi:MAG: ABC transporter permease [Pseudomonadales bacterium]|nr:ABC transporter permease [Pseudomonadales bacterium]
MEIRPILSAMWQNKTGPVLISLQIAFTLAVVVNAMFLINVRIEKMDRPVGIDTPNIYNLSTVPTVPVEGVRDFIERDMAAIRSIPGVVDASPVLTFLQGGSTRAEGYRPNEDLADANYRIVNVNFVDEHGLDALGIELLRGRNFRKDEIRYLDANERALPDVAILTESMGRDLFGDEDPLGKDVYYADEENRTMRVIGVIKDVAAAWLASDSPRGRKTVYNFMLQPFVETKSGRGYNYAIRAEPGALNAVMSEVEKKLFEVDPNRLIERTYTQKELLARSYGTDRAVIQILSIVAGLMVVITALGIVGLASFTVNQRTRQIGTRRALGAKRRDILRYFITENVLLTTFGVVLGSFMAYGLHLALFNLLRIPKLDPGYLPVGIVVLYLLGVLAVFGPARRASMIPPGIASRTV